MAGIERVCWVVVVAFLASCGNGVSLVGTWDSDGSLWLGDPVVGEWDLDGSSEDGVFTNSLIGIRADGTFVEETTDTQDRGASGMCIVRTEREGTVTRDDAGGTITLVDGEGPMVTRMGCAEADGTTQEAAMTRVVPFWPYELSGGRFGAGPDIGRLTLYPDTERQLVGFRDASISTLHATAVTFRDDGTATIEGTRTFSSAEPQYAGCTETQRVQLTYTNGDIADESDSVPLALTQVGATEVERTSCANAAENGSSELSGYWSMGMFRYVTSYFPPDDAGIALDVQTIYGTTRYSFDRRAM